LSRKKREITKVDPETKRIVEEALYEWEAEVKKKEKLKEQTKNNTNLFEGDKRNPVDPTLSEESRKEKAEMEKNKGNESLRSGVGSINKI
jgi:hypothetical protein